MTKQTIEVEGLPEGWKAAEIRIDPDQYNKYLGDDGFLYWEAKIKLEKIQPRRIVIEETEELNETYSSANSPAPQTLKENFHITGMKYRWREVKETDLSLPNDEHKLYLNTEDARELFNYLPNNTKFYAKLIEFIGDK